jgi:hypothetical protein
LIVLVLVGIVLGVSILPVTTRQGVDFVVTTHHLPLYLKAIEFVDRDLNYRVLARTITAGRTTEEARVLAIFDWTRDHIRDLGFPVVDDHIWHVIIRGYGVADQKADVFTTLATYSGVRAYWIYLGTRDERLPLSLASIGGRWCLFDVANGVAFRKARRRLLSADEVARRPSLIDAVAPGRTYLGRAYAEYFRDFEPPTPPDTLRAEQQMPWPRLYFEIRRIVGLGGRQWNPTRMRNGHGNEPPAARRGGGVE